MTLPGASSTPAPVDDEPAGAVTQRYLLRLFVAGTSPVSMKAIAAMRLHGEAGLFGPYELEIIDIYQQPGLASQAQIIAAPTLVREYPLPLRRIVAEMRDASRIVLLMNFLVEVPPETPP